MQWLSYSAPLLEGAWVTVQLTFYSTTGRRGGAACIGKLSRNWLIRLSVTFISVQGTSLLVQLFGCTLRCRIWQLIGVDLRLPAVLAGTWH